VLEQIRLQRSDHGIEQLRPDFTGLGSVERVKSEVYRLAAARYFIIFLGAAMLLSIAAQALWFDGGVSLSRVMKIGLVSILGPGLVWAASDKEVRLLQELERRNRQLEQRVRENKALNRMTQAHLADCSIGPSEYQPAPHAYRLPANQAGALATLGQGHLNREHENATLLHPVGAGGGNREVQAVGAGHGHPA
jgi:hypothetical protein